jgi:hypothetical protein
MTEFKEKEVIVIEESLLESVIADLISMLALCGVAAFGIWIGSAAAEWVGIVLVLWWMVGTGRRIGERMTVAEAIAYLNEVESPQND